MARTKSLSIRVKILLLLTLLPLLVLGAYLLIAIQVFQDDKIAYVYEGTTSISRTLGLQANTDFNAILTSVRPILQEYGEQQTFGPISKALMNVEGPIVWVAAFMQGSDGKFAQKGLVVRDQGLESGSGRGTSEKKTDVPGTTNGTMSAGADEAGLLSGAPGSIAGNGDSDKADQVNKQNHAQAALEKVLAPGNFLETAMQQKRTVTIPLKEDAFLLSEYVNDPLNHRQIVFLVYFKSDDLFQGFRAPGGSNNFLVDGSGKVLIGPSEIEGKSLDSQFTLAALKNNDANTMNGTEEVKNTSGEAVLASFSKAQFANLTVVSSVPKKAALQAVTVLIRKSIIFFAVLLCVTVIVSLVASKGITAALTQLYQATQRVAQGRFDIRVKVNSNDEVGSLAASFNKMAAEVQRLLSETAEKARMESELKTAQTVQETLFPPVSAQIADLAVVGYYEPASEIGGDWWHYNWVNGKVFLWIGDATGHGAPAALITSAAKSASTIIENLKVDPATALDLLNRAIFDISKGNIMMTFFLACYDPRNRTLTYSNASHESPFLIRKSDNPPKKRDLVPLNEVNNPRLGQSRETRYQQTTIDLCDGDRILFYTDGIPDIQNPKKEAWGEREFIKAVLSSNKEYPPIDEAVSSMAKSFKAHRQGATLIDDITFFMVEVRGGIS